MNTANARDFIEEHGNALHPAELSVLMDDGDPAAVVDALKGFQNPDGGFGHGLESDLRTSASSVLATIVALQRRTRRSSATRCAICSKAMNTRTGRSSMPAATTPHMHPGGPIEATGRASAWTTAACRTSSPTQAPRFSVTCSSTTAAPLLGFIQTIMDPALNRLSAPLEMHDLQCYVRLFESPSLPGAARDAMLPLLLAHACDLVRIAAPDWDEYALMPLHIISGPDSMFMGFFGEAVAANFEWLSAQQCTDGSWAPSWSWGGSFPSTWEVVEYEIRATLTLDVLQKLKQFSRL
jgi:hypothetical protein